MPSDNEFLTKILRQLESISASLDHLSGEVGGIASDLDDIRKGDYDPPRGVKRQPNPSAEPITRPAETDRW